MILKNVRVLSPVVGDHVILCGKRDFADGIKLRISRWGDYLEGSDVSSLVWLAAHSRSLQEGGREEVRGDGSRGWNSVFAVIKNCQLRK